MSWLPPKYGACSLTGKRCATLHPGRPMRITFLQRGRMRPSMISALSSRGAEGDEGSRLRHPWAGYEHRRRDPSSPSLLGMTTRLALLGTTRSNQFQLTANRAVLATALIAVTVTACADSASTTITDPL